MTEINKESSSEDMIVDFLKYSINNLERQIALIDQKSGILVGGLGLFYIALSLMMNQLFLKSSLLYINIFSFIALIGIFVLMVLCMFGLMTTLRLSYGASSELDSLSQSDEFMWFSNNFPATGEDYKSRMKSTDNFSIRKYYMQLHFAVSQLILKKNSHYQSALDRIKLMFIMSLYSVVFLFLLKVVSLILAFLQRDVVAI